MVGEGDGPTLRRPDIGLARSAFSAAPARGGGPTLLTVPGRPAGCAPLFGAITGLVLPGYLHRPPGDLLRKALRQFGRGADTRSGADSAPRLAGSNNPRRIPGRALCRWDPGQCSSLLSRFSG
ncbi:hypothetical protein GCM10018781_76530 [Kitasatospora indigofera]|uniref:Uncharacterized protein n=1 Tax=Kitasatospora indigofera TaxID=67307 RepID=A0A919D8S4_9ACTN|nr:hypothetical protein GCM10018781_76530 [Kitasatospora indigofera]